MGGTPKGLPAGLATKYSGSKTWKLMVREAIAQKVNALLLLGDVVDYSNRFFEALGPLAEGIDDLKCAGIQVFAVAGNHDFEALESVARVTRTDTFHLLGRGGQWEQVRFSANGMSVQLFGWSFPKLHVSENPLRMFPRDQVDTACLHLGLLHADRDGTNSPYAPVPSADFAQTGVNRWLLGHIHKPDPLLAGEGVFYTGSPAGSDPTETGLHGPILLDLSANPPDYRRLPISPLRYETIDLELGELAGGDLHSRLVERTRSWAQPILDEQPEVQDLVVTGRFRAVSSTSEYHLFDEGLQELLQGVNFIPFGDGRQLWFMGARMEIRPPLDLAELPREAGIIGQTARLIHDLQTTPNDAALPEETRRLVKRAGDRMRDIANLATYRDLNEELADDARRLLLEQSWRLLTDLVAQREVPS